MVQRKNCFNFIWIIVWIKELLKDAKSLRDRGIFRLQGNPTNVSINDIFKCDLDLRKILYNMIQNRMK